MKVNKASKNYLIALRDGNPNIIKELYSTSFPVVRDWILTNSGSREDAMDIFHDALEIVVHHVHHPDSKIWEVDLKPYLFRICRNKWVDKLRKKKIFREKVSFAEKERYNSTEESNDLLFNEGEEQVLLKTILDETYSIISDTCRKLIELINEGMSSEAVVKELSMKNANTMYRRKFACLKRWRELLENNPSYLRYKQEYGK